MKRTLLFSTIIVTVLFAVGASPPPEEYYPGWGRVLNSRGDLLPYWPVHLYENYSYRETIYTDYRGHWQYNFPNCVGIWVACAIGGPLWEDSICVWEFIDCDGITMFPDLVIQCGGPKEPPCPKFQQ